MWLLVCLIPGYTGCSKGYLWSVIEYFSWTEAFTSRLSKYIRSRKKLRRSNSALHLSPY